MRAIMDKAATDPLKWSSDWRSRFLTLLPTAVLAATVLTAGTPVVTSASADVGESWTYKVTYGEEQTYWTQSVALEEISGGAMCARIDTSFDSPPERSWAGARTITTEDTYWRALSDDNLRTREQAIDVVDYGMNVFVTDTFSEYTPGNGKPFVLGETWTYHRYTDYTFGHLDRDYLAELAGSLQSVTVPAGTFNCYAVTHTRLLNPLKTFTEWWDADGLFTAAPVKVVDSDSYNQEQILELESFSTVPQVSFSVPAYSADEDAGSIAIEVNLVAGGSETVTVDYSTSDGTATAPEDYTAAAGTLTFTSGDTRHTFHVPIIDDTTPEGNETVTLTLSNPTGAILRLPNNATLTIDDDENEPPVATNDTYSVLRGGTLVVDAPGVLTNDNDSDADPLTALTTSDPAHGLLVFDSDGSFTYVNDGTEAEVDSFTYVANDSLSDSNVATVHIHIGDVGDSWVYEVTYGGEVTHWTQSVTIEEPVGDVMCARIESEYDSPPVRVAEGIRLTVRGNVVWRALADRDLRFGQHTSSAIGSTVTTTNTYSDYGPGHGQPLFPGQAWSYHQHISTSIGVAFDYDYDAEVAAALDLVTVPAGTFNCYRVTHRDRADPLRTSTEWWDASGLFVHAPVRVENNADYAEPETLELESYPVPPHLTFSRSDYSVTEDAGLVTIAVELVAGGTDGVTVDYASSDGTAIAGLDYSSVAGTLTFSPGDTLQTFDIGIVDDVDVEGNETVLLTLSTPEGAVLVLPGTVTLTIDDDESEPPEAANDTYSVDEGDTLHVAAPGVLTNDSDKNGDFLTARKLSDPMYGSLSMNADGSFTYIHGGSETTYDSFTYVANDGYDESDAATVSITVNPVNDPPLAHANNYHVCRGCTLSVPAPGVLGIDTDAEGDPLSAIKDSDPDYGTLALDNDGSFTYVHDGSETTSDSFTYVANDGEDDSESAAVNISITALPYVDVTLSLAGGDRPDSQGWEIPVKISFFSPGADVLADVPLYSFELATTKSGGKVRCQVPEVVPGMYDVTVGGEQSLVNVMRSVAVTAPGMSIDIGMLVHGDANGDQSIDLGDFMILAYSWLGYDVRADFNRDMVVDASDLLILAENWLESSPVETPRVAHWTGNETVQTRDGAVRGFEDEANTWVWKAIPYAKPPVDELRWKAPRDAELWDGIREETEYSSMCTQRRGSAPNLSIEGSEDCLYVNVWRPRSEETDLPVFFWSHPGADVYGSARQSGSKLANTANMIVVNVEYRLGPFGWFTHPSLRSGEPGDALDDSGNFGTLDLIKALHWVRDNIEAFGGNPDRVLIGGQSGGGWNVGSLLMSPLASGLFHAALTQSGGPVSKSVEDGEFSAEYVISNLLVNDGTAADEAEAQAVIDVMSNAEIEAYLRSKSADDILMDGYGHSSDEPDFLGGCEVIFADGTVIVAEGMASFFETGTYPNKVPLIMGSTTEELKAYYYLNPLFDGKDDVYQVIMSYSNHFGKAEGDAKRTVLCSFADQPDTYIYKFHWGEWKSNEEGSVMGYPWGLKYGAAHGMDRRFLFGTFQFGPITDQMYTEENRPGREALSEALMTYVGQFARTGNPNDPDSGLPEWEPWSNEDGGPKYIKLDADYDTLQIEMSTDKYTCDGVYERLEAEVPEPLASEVWQYVDSHPGLTTAFICND